MPRLISAVARLLRPKKVRREQVAKERFAGAAVNAFAPADAPKLAIGVVVENGRHGSVAAMVARKVFDAYLLPPETAAKSETATGEPPPPAGGTDE